MKLGMQHTAGTFLLAAALAVGVSAPLPTDGAAGPNERGDVSGTSHRAVGGGGTEGTTGLSSDDGCPSSMSAVSGARGPAGPTIDSSTTGLDSRPPSGIG